MSDQFTISELGLRLIKAYEGFSPRSREVTDGAFTIGYGHALEAATDDSVTEEEAEELLKDDVAVIEEFINTNIYAALTQGQFDALCSLIFSIGPDAFKSSEIFHALNQGQVIEAANGFDAWRLGEFGGQVYVVDALVRRRTAEKSLFLRPTTKLARAPRFRLDALRDADVMVENARYASRREARVADEQTRDTVRRAAARRSSETVTLVDALPEAGETALMDEDENLTNQDAPLDLTEDDDVPAMDESPAFSLSGETDSRAFMSETGDLDNLEGELDETDLADPEALKTDNPSPIAEAAAEVSDRLDALIAPNDNEAQILDIEARKDANAPIAFIDDTAEDPVFSDPGEAYDPAELTQDRADSGSGLWAYTIMVLIGLAALSAGLYMSLTGSITDLGQYGPLITFAGIFLGAMLFMAGTYYLIKSFFRSDSYDDYLTAG